MSELTLNEKQEDNESETAQVRSTLSAKESKWWKKRRRNIDHDHHRPATSKPVKLIQPLQSHSHSSVSTSYRYSSNLEHQGIRCCCPQAP